MHAARRAHAFATLLPPAPRSVCRALIAPRRYAAVALPPMRAKRRALSSRRHAAVVTMRLFCAAAGRRLMCHIRCFGVACRLRFVFRSMRYSAAAPLYRCD